MPNCRHCAGLDAAVLACDHCRMATGNLVIRGPEDGSRPTMSELVMAWARDRATGEPRYILELGHDQRGAKCGCECASCGAPLTAVNATKQEFVRRPHFRHPEGAARTECIVLAARAAVLRQLRDEGWLELPRRRMSGSAIGLSGNTYEAWVEVPAERVRITHVDFRDRAAAVLKLDDGRQLRVLLTGTAGNLAPQLDDAGLPVPTIFLAADDLSVAAMDPAEIRNRLSLAPEGIHWCGHWSDLKLQQRADAEAQALAEKFIDALPNGFELPPDLDPALRWQTVLHYEVKNILTELFEVMAPAIERTVEVRSPSGRILRETVIQESDAVELTNVRLEHRFGGLVPDITCEGWASGGNFLHPMLIEITVTNHIDEERHRRIQDMGAYALEIDLSRTGGRVTREELRRLVADEVGIKRWLHFPDFESKVTQVRSRLEQEAVDELAALNAAKERAKRRRDAVLATPVAAIAQGYLAEVTTLLETEKQLEGPALLSAGSPIYAARERVADAADKLALHGYPEAGDINLIGAHGILARLLSIRSNRGVGYRYDSAMPVLNAIRQARGVERSNHSLFFIAARTYKPPLTPSQQNWFDAWTEEVKASIREGEITYLRDPAYDQLLSILFPEMAPALAKSRGKRIPSDQGDLKIPRRSATPERRQAGFLETQPKAEAMRQRLLDTPPSAFWLKGRDLEAWRRANPEAARGWFDEAPGT